MGKKTGLVLTGGSLRGIAAQAGILKALEEKGFRPTAVAGASAGAIVGALYCGPQGAGRADEVVRRLGRVRREDFIDPDTVGTVRALFRSLRGWTGYYRGESLLRWLRDQVGADTRLERCDPPLLISVTNVSKAIPQMKSTGPLAEWARASAGVPLAYRLIRVEGDLYADGGAVDNVPASLLAENRTDLDVFLVATALKLQADPPVSDERFLERSFSAIRGLGRMLEAVATELHLDDLDVGPGKELRVLRVNPGEIGFDEPEKLPTAIEMAYRDARQQIADGKFKIDDLLP